MIWRLVMKGTARLEEIETHWSLADVITANTLLDCQELADYLAQPKKEGTR